MATVDTALQKLLVAPLQTAVYCYASAESYLLQHYAAKTVSALCKAAEDAEVTRIDGPLPSIEEATAAAGTISMFGTKRIVQLVQIQPYAMAQEDIAALVDLINSLENAVLVLTVEYSAEFKTAKGQKESKKTKELLAAVQKAGFYTELAKPSATDAQKAAEATAKALGASFAPGAAARLVERTGVDTLALENETAKLAAAAGYGEITSTLVAGMGTQNVEADVFEMIKFLHSGNVQKAFLLLQQLISQQNEPIAIAAALSGSFVDMLRVKLGEQAGKGYVVVHKECRYTGSDYRLKMAAQAASRFTLPQLRQCVSILCRLDKEMKSTAADNVVLLQTALAEINLTRKS